MTITRRQLLVVALPSALLAGAAACKKNERTSYLDVTGLAPADVDARSTLGYADPTPYPDKTCDACGQWVAAPTIDACGGCKILKGVIGPKAYCKSFLRRS